MEANLANNQTMSILLLVLVSILLLTTVVLIGIMIAKQLPSNNKKLVKSQSITGGFSLNLKEETLIINANNRKFAIDFPPNEKTNIIATADVLESNYKIIKSTDHEETRSSLIEIVKGKINELKKFSYADESELRSLSNSVEIALKSV